MDFSNLLGGSSQQQGKGNSTAATIFGGYNSSQQTQTIIPWLIGGAAVIALGFVFVLIAAMRR